MSACSPINVEEPISCMSEHFGESVATHVVVAGLRRAKAMSARTIGSTLGQRPQNLQGNEHQWRAHSRSIRTKRVSSGFG